MHLSNLDKEIIRQLQEDLPITSRPFLDMSTSLNIDEEMLLDRIREFVNRGLIRRFGGALRHRQMGFEANAMIVWQVEEGRAAEVGTKIAEFPEVSHCYERRVHPQWSYNIFSMVHGKSKQDCEILAERIAKAVEVDSYRLLYSSRELKKNSMRYFLEK